MTPRHLALSRLSLTASLIDLLLVLLLMRAAYEFGIGLVGFPLILVPVLVVPVLHLLATEFVFSGYSLGKICIGLRVRSRDGYRVIPLSVRVRQFLRKSMRLGLPSFGLTGLASYYDNDDVFLSSRFVQVEPQRRATASKPNSVTSPKSRRVSKRGGPALVVANGQHRGETLALNSLKDFKSRGIVRIGRDASWSDLRLSKEAQISARHCVLKFDVDTIAIIDGSGTKTPQPSRNGTFVDETRVPANSWTRLAGKTTFRVDSVEIEIFL